MHNFKKHILSLIILMAFSLVFFQSKNIEASACRHSYENVSSSGLTAGNYHLVADKSFIQSPESVPQMIRHNTRQLNYRKKLKRWIQLFSGIRPPVKDAEQSCFYLSLKHGYNTPYFLSHLHAFLFRLTPF
jgi:hypothetical protein